MELSFEFWYIFPLAILIATQKKLPEDIMKISVAILFVIVGAFMLYSFVL